MIARDQPNQKEERHLQWKSETLIINWRRHRTLNRPSILQDWHNLILQQRWHNLPLFLGHINSEQDRHAVSLRISKTPSPEYLHTIASNSCSPGCCHSPSSFQTFNSDLCCLSTKKKDCFFLRLWAGNCYMFMGPFPLLGCLIQAFIWGFVLTLIASC